MWKDEENTLDNSYGDFTSQSASHLLKQVTVYGDFKVHDRKIIVAENKTLVNKK